MPVDPDWLRAEGLPPNVAGLMATRAGGVSSGPYAGLNLRPPDLPAGPGPVDDPRHVTANQVRFGQGLGGARPVWLNQVHGVQVVRLHGPQDAAMRPYLQADASVTTARGVACTVLVADCLPVLFSTLDGGVVGAAHAGWRGLCAGVLEATVAAMLSVRHGSQVAIVAWLGACIGPQAFEVGDDVRDAFGPEAAPYFVRQPTPGKWLADLAGLARWRLARIGVRVVGGGQWCTFSDPSRFFSFRRDRVTGRHAAAIWRC